MGEKFNISMMAGERKTVDEIVRFVMFNCEGLNDAQFAALMSDIGKKSRKRLEAVMAKIKANGGVIGGDDD